MLNRDRSYDRLLDAEYEVRSRSGREPGKIEMIKALREASGLGLKESVDVLEGYMSRRENSADDVPRSFDDLLDAERAAASRDERPISKISLIKALREASGLGLKESKDEVEDYLRRRGGKGLSESPGSGGCVVVVLLAAAVVIGLAFWWA